MIEENDAKVVEETPVTWSGLAVMGSHPHEMSCHRKPLPQAWEGEMLPQAKRRERESACRPTESP
jgi:hypothetical protein